MKKNLLLIALVDVIVLVATACGKDATVNSATSIRRKALGSLQRRTVREGLFSIRKDWSMSEGSTTTVLT